MLSQGENLGELSLDSIRRLNPFFGPGVKTAVPIVRNVCMSTISETASPPRLLGGKAAKLMELRAAGFPVPEFIFASDDLSQVLSKLGFPVAVRASAEGEDGAEFSYAGLFKSVLNLKSLEEVSQAVAACRLSRDSDAVKSYCRRHALSAEEINLDVIVQKMIQPELAGVAFSVDPVTGGNQVRIEACVGTGDKLLSGQLAPLPADHSLLQRHRPKIEQLARRVQRHFGEPQDIEFAIQDGAIYLLQARPITRLHFEPQVGEWTTAMFRDGGVAEGVCSPFMWSLYQPVWEDTLKGMLREIRLLKFDFPAARLFFGRPYWNLGAVKECLSGLPGFNEDSFETDLNIASPSTRSPRQTSKSFWNILRAAPSLVAINRRLNLQPQEAEETLRAGEFSLQALAECSTSDALQTLRRLVEVEYRKIESTYFRTIFSAVLAKMEFLLRFPQADYPRLLTGLPEPKYVAQLREFQRADKSSAADWECSLQNIAHHCPLGLDVRFPRLDEQLDLLRELSRHQATRVSGTRQSVEFEHSNAEALARLRPWNRRMFSAKLARLRQLVWLREELRDLSNRAYYWIRRVVLQLAAERGLGEDIFQLTYKDILQNDQSNLETNRDAFLAFRHCPAPPEIRSASSDPNFNRSPTPSHRMAGLGVSPGSITGRAHVVNSLREAFPIEPGSILVCRFIEPSWVPVLDHVVAVVAESGGVLSHAAVIAREYGIPAVLGVAGATRDIQTGDYLQVQGDRGIVEKLSGKISERSASIQTNQVSSPSCPD